MSVSCTHGPEAYCDFCKERMKMWDRPQPNPVLLQGAVKSDGFKSRVELIDPRFIEGIGRVLAHGAKKYADDNWRKGFTWRRLIGAGMRHWLKFAGGEDIDPEFNEHHLLHEACESMFAYIHWLDGLGTDDRVKK